MVPAWPKLEIAEPDIEQRGQLVRNARDVAEEADAFIHRHVENVGDIFPLVSDLERFAIVTLAAADLALDIDVRQEMHLDLDQAAAFAVLAPAALDVEAESAGIVTAHTGGRQLRKKLANRCECAGVSNRIRARRPADRALVDHDRLIYLLQSAERFEAPRLLLRIVKLAKQRAAQNIVDQRRFSAAGNTGDAGETAERQSDCDVLQVVLGGADNGEPAGQFGARGGRG